MTDLVSILETAYAPHDDDARWADEVVAAATPFFGTGPVGLTSIRHSADLRSFVLPRVQGPLAMDARVLLRDLVGDDLVRALQMFFYPPDVVCSWRALTRLLPHGSRSVFDARTSAFPANIDFLGLMMHPAPGCAAVLYAARGMPLRLSSAERRSFLRLALHLEAGLRLRLRPESLLGVLSSDGKLVHRAVDRGPSTLALPLLQHHVRRIERARTSRGRREPDSLSLWGALVGGRASLVPRREGSRWHYLVLENPPARQPMRALSATELDLVSYAARGLPQKMVGYALGLPAYAVSAGLASAASKIGLTTRMDLVRIAAMLARDPRARFEETALTTSERDVLELLARGLSNREIAAFRGRSLRTIANQVASLLAKTRAPSRRALVAAKAPRVSSWRIGGPKGSCPSSVRRTA